MLIIRPFESIDPAQLLLASRVLLESRIGTSLVERGTGARYITEATLESLKIPLWLSHLDPGLFQRYRRAIRTENGLDRVWSIEAEFRRRIGLAAADSAHCRSKTICIGRSAT